MNEQPHRVSIIIPTFNRKKIVFHLLKSLQNITPKPYEIIVVDNGSTDGTAEFISDNFPLVKVIRYQERQGPHYSRYVGAKLASGDLIAYLEDDVIVTRQWLQNICSFFRDPTVGLAGSMILNPDGRPLLPVIRHHCFGDVVEFADPKNGPCEVEYVNEAGVIYRRKFLSLGLLDEELIGDAWGESIALCSKIKNAGYKILFVPSAVILHFPQAFGGNKRFLKGKIENLFYYFSNRTYLYLKYQCSSPLMVMPFLLIYRLVLAIKQALNFKTPIAIFYAVKGIFEGIKRFVKSRNKLFC